MSRTAFAKLTAHLNADEAFQRTFYDRFGGEGSEIPARELIAFASEHGYTFSLEDASDELSEAELEDVAGGVSLDYSMLRLNQPSFKLLSGGYFLPGDRFLPGDQY